MEILITGGEQGLGKAIVDLLKPHKVHNIYGHDIMDAIGTNSLQQFIRNSVEWNGNFDYVINNFGINHLSAIGKTPPEDGQIMEANVMTPYWVVDALVHNICDPTHVLNISSQTYRVPQRKTALYCASKAAVSHMTKVMARELAPNGWVINAFAPGKILGTKMTEMTDAQVNKIRGWTQEEADEYAKKLIPMGRFMDLDEAARIAINILRTPEYVNGTTIEAFGGI